MKSFGDIIAIYNNGFIIDCNKSNEVLKPRIIGLIECNVTGDEKVEHFIENILFWNSIDIRLSLRSWCKIVLHTAVLFLINTPLIWYTYDRMPFQTTRSPGDRFMNRILFSSLSNNQGMSDVFLTMFALQNWLLIVSIKAFIELLSYFNVSNVAISESFKFMKKL